MPNIFDSAGKREQEGQKDRRKEKKIDRETTKAEMSIIGGKRENVRMGH